MMRIFFSYRIGVPFPRGPDGSARLFFESRVQLSRRRSSRVSKSMRPAGRASPFRRKRGRAAFGAPRPQRLKKCLHNKQAPFGQYASGRTPPAASRAGPSTRANRGTAYRKTEVRRVGVGGVGRVPPQAITTKPPVRQGSEQNDQGSRSSPPAQAAHRRLCIRRLSYNVPDTGCKSTAARRSPPAGRAA